MPNKPNTKTKKNKKGRAHSEDQRYTTLATFVQGTQGTKPVLEWSTQLVQLVESIKKEKKIGTKSVPMYFGELERKHGWEEATAFIAKGKYRKIVDAQGDAQYIKTQQYYVDEAAHSTTVSVERSLLLLIGVNLFIY